MNSPLLAGPFLGNPDEGKVAAAGLATMPPPGTRLAVLNVSQLRSVQAEGGLCGWPGGTTGAWAVVALLFLTAAALLGSKRLIRGRKMP